MTPETTGKLNNLSVDQFPQKCKVVTFRLNDQLTPMGILTFPLGDCQYNGKQLTGISYEDKVPKAIPHNYEFTYDGSNNLTAIRSFDKEGNNRVARLKYPSGTKNSMAANVAVTYSINNDIEIDDSCTMQFNSKFQLTAMTKNKKLLRTDTYNLKGNCMKTTIYTGGKITAVYIYTAYDSKAATATLNRSLQIYLGDYNANNITKRIRTIYSNNGKPVTNTLVMNYSYNTSGFPIKTDEQTYATYDCGKIIPKL